MWHCDVPRTVACQTCCLTVIVNFRHRCDRTTSGRRTGRAIDQVVPPGVRRGGEATSGAVAISPATSLGRRALGGTRGSGSAMRILYLMDMGWTGPVRIALTAWGSFSARVEEPAGKVESAPGHPVWGRMEHNSCFRSARLRERRPR